MIRKVEPVLGRDHARRRCHAGGDVARHGAGFRVRPPARWRRTQRTIKMIVPFTPGSPNDVIARLLAQHLSARLGQGVIVDNRPGAGTTTGMKAAAIAEPDGNTLLFQSSSLVVAPAMYKNLDYDPLKAFAPVANVVEGHWVTVVPPSLPVQLDRRVHRAMRRPIPGTLNFGFGQGTAPQLVGEWFKIRQRPRRRQRALSRRRAGDHRHAGRPHPSQHRHHRDAGAADQGRQAQGDLGLEPGALPELPDVPTMIESGFPGLSLSFWAGLWAPAGTPDAGRRQAQRRGQRGARLAGDARRAWRGSASRRRPGSPQDFAAFIAAESPEMGGDRPRQRREGRINARHREETMISRRGLLSGAAAFGIGAATDARAQTYPDKPIKLIVPFPPGGPIDTMARLAAQVHHRRRRPAGGGREPSRRRLHHRLEGGRGVAARRLHAAVRLVRLARGRALALRQRRHRSAQDVRADLELRAAAACHGGAGRRCRPRRSRSSSPTPRPTPAS